MLGAGCEVWGRVAVVRLGLIIISVFVFRLRFRYCSSSFAINVFNVLHRSLGLWPFAFVFVFVFVRLCP